jgi:hypothetical protein
MRICRPILFVEDDPDDFFLASNELKRVFVRNRIERANTIEEMIKFLFPVARRQPRPTTSFHRDIGDGTIFCILKNFCS